MDTSDRQSCGKYKPTHFLYKQSVELNMEEKPTKNSDFSLLFYKHKLMYFCPALGKTKAPNYFKC